MKPPRLWLALALPVLASTVLRSQATQTHRLIPQTFYNTFSGAHPPALRIKPGDRVVTKTIDASGTDWDGKSVASYATGQKPRSEPEYPSDGVTDADGWTTVSGVYQAPSAAREAIVELEFRWAPHARLTWAD